MASLLGRPLTRPETWIQSSVRKILDQGIQATRTLHLSQKFGQSKPEFFFAAILSLIDRPPSSTSQRSLCHWLINVPGFLAYLGNPDQFSRPELLEISRALIRIMPRLDVAFVSMLSAWKEESRELHHPTFLRVLDILDEISPGGRLVMGLTRLMRELEPALESKAALSLGRRVQNPAAVARQLSSTDSRVRANCVEALWGNTTPAVIRLFREALADPANRVAGNAIIGLWLSGAPDAIAILIQMINENKDGFGPTAAWVVARMGDPNFQKPSVRAGQWGNNGGKAPLLLVKQNN
jgi:hypothetical protein